MVLLGVTVAVSCKVSPLLSVADVWLNVMPVASCGVTVTMHDALKLEPSAVVTVIVAVPRALAVTRPLLLTVAMFVLLDDQVAALFVALLGVTL